MYFLFSYFIKVKCQRSVFKNVGVHSVHVLYIFYFAATELGHVYVTGSDDQISLVQQNHTHLFFDPRTRNVTLIRKLNTDKGSETLTALVLDCYIVGEQDPVK